MWNDSMPLISQDTQIPRLIYHFLSTFTENQWPALYMLPGVFHVDSKWPYLHIKVPGCYLLFENSGE